MAGALEGLNALTAALWIRSDVINTDRGFIHFEDPSNSGWDGLIDDVRIYDRVLTAAEIQVVQAQ